MSFDMMPCSEEEARYMSLCDNCVKELRSQSQLMILGNDNPEQKIQEPDRKPYQAEQYMYSAQKKTPADQPQESSWPANFLFWAGGIWFVLAIIYYFSSSAKLNDETSRIIGADSVANFQGTLFTVGAVLAGVLNTVGGFIVKEIRDSRK